jgi:hypothetical protein
MDGVLDATPDDYPDQIKQEIVSIEEIREKYEIMDITIVSDCIGCIYGAPGQRSHMESPTGFLHDPEKCSCAE